MLNGLSFQGPQVLQYKCVKYTCSVVYGPVQKKMAALSFFRIIFTLCKLSLFSDFISKLGSPTGCSLICSFMQLVNILPDCLWPIIIWLFQQKYHSRGELCNIRKNLDELTRKRARVGKRKGARVGRRKIYKFKCK